MARMSPYGDFDTMLSTLIGQLSKGRYILGDTFSAADVLWGGALKWTTGFGIVPKTPEIEAYLGRVGGRPAALKVEAADAGLATKQGRT